MSKAEQYREHAQRCDRLLALAQDPRTRQRLRRERQDWLELAANCEARQRASFSDSGGLDTEMTPAALRAFEATEPRRAQGWR